MAANLLKIQELHREILFSEWESQLTKSKKVTSRATATMNGVIELVNDSLYMANLSSDCSPVKLPKAKALEYQWRQEIASREEQIGKVKNLTWDEFWFFLIKLHSQQMAMKFLFEAVNLMVPKLSDATYTTQLYSRMIHPPKIQPMLSICQLQVQEKKQIQRISSEAITLLFS